jgi:hypothetical protein
VNRDDFPARRTWAVFSVLLMFLFFRVIDMPREDTIGAASGTNRPSSMAMNGTRAQNAPGEARGARSMALADVAQHCVGTRTGDAISRSRPPCAAECALRRRRVECAVSHRYAGMFALGVVVLLLYCRPTAGMSASELLSAVPVHGTLSPLNRQHFYFVNVSDPALPSSAVAHPPQTDPHNGDHNNNRKA